MPLPPPPAAALIRIGQPIRSPIATTSSAEPTGSVVPGMIGPPAACIACRAAVFEPIGVTLARIASVPLVVVLFVWGFHGHDYWATGVFIAAMATEWFDGRVARRRGRISTFGSLLDPVADKILVLSVLVVLIDRDVFPGWMVAAIVSREFL